MTIVRRRGLLLSGSAGLLLVVLGAGLWWRAQPRTLAHATPISSVAYAPDGALLAAGGIDATITLWRVADGQQLHTLRGHGAMVFGLAFAPDGRTLALADSNNVKLYVIR